MQNTADAKPRRSKTPPPARSGNAAMTPLRRGAEEATPAMTPLRRVAEADDGGAAPDGGEEVVG